MKMSYWSKTVVPGFKKMFEKSGKKAAAAEACKAFAETQEGITKELEEKKPELQDKVAKLYEDSPPEIKALLKEPKASGLKKHAEKVQKFLEGLVEIEFPGAKPVCEAAKVAGPGLVAAPITFVFEKVCTFVVTDEKKEEVAAEGATAEVAATGEETSVGTKDKEIVVEGETKAEEEITPAATAPVEEVITPEKKVESPAPVVEEVITTEKKVESAPEPPVVPVVAEAAAPVAAASAAEPAAATTKVETPTVVAAAAAPAPTEPAPKA